MNKWCKPTYTTVLTHSEMDYKKNIYKKTQQSMSSACGVNTVESTTQYMGNKIQ